MSLKQINKKRILLKITGAAFSAKEQRFDKTLIQNLATQVKELSNKFSFSFVTGAGNLFRGNEHGKALGLNPNTSHQIGMISTMINGLILKDVFKAEGIDCILLNAFYTSQLESVTQEAIETSISQDKPIIFVGGTGNPFFSTDTAAVLRGLQIGACEIWKGTNVEGVFEEDPNKNPNAKFINKITFKNALEKRLGILDQVAFVLAEENKLPIKIFNIFSTKALEKATKNDDTFGSLIY